MMVDQVIKHRGSYIYIVLQGALYLNKLPRMNNNLCCVPRIFFGLVSGNTILTQIALTFALMSYTLFLLNYYLLRIIYGGQSEFASCEISQL